ncbi:MAG: hypothetical protein ACXVEE_21340 [Polyangiales bacterium]
MSPLRRICRTTLTLSLLTGLASACTHRTSAAPEEPARRFGEAMTEVGHRFERVGRAAQASQWDLVDYDLGEIDEVFTQDLPHARTPEDVHIDLHVPSAAFARSQLPPLHDAAAHRDRAAFEAAFAGAAAACNACHQSAGKPFIVVPSRIGDAVPQIGPPAQ